MGKGRIPDVYMIFYDHSKGNSLNDTETEAVNITFHQLPTDDDKDGLDFMMHVNRTAAESPPKLDTICVYAPSLHVSSSEERDGLRAFFNNATSSTCNHSEDAGVRCQPSESVQKKARSS